MKKLLRNNRTLILILLSVLMMAEMSCKKYPDPTPYFEKYEADSILKLKKVLVISIDGVAGAEMDSIAPPNITALLADAKYSYALQQDATLTDASSWATILTGVSAAKHSIYDSSFVAAADSSGNGQGFEDQNAFYPNIYTYILQNKSQYQTAIITPWASLANYAKYADYHISAADDKTVRDSAVSILGTANDLGFMVVDFNEAELAGNKGGFFQSNSNYKNAILQSDSYVGDILNALKTRSNYDVEDWLIIITTNHGGSASSPKPGFVVYSNPAFQKEEVQKYGFNLVTFNSDGSGYPSVYATLNSNNVNSGYDFSKEFTIQFDVMLPGATGGYPIIFGNKTDLNGSNAPTPGFSFLIDGSNPTCTFNVTSGYKYEIKTSATMADGTWHTITATYSGGIISMFVDGVFQKSGALPEGVNLNGPDPLAIGNQPSAEGVGSYDGIQENIHNIEIFNIALNAADIQQNICLQDITRHPYYKNLIAFWPCDDGQGSKCQNTINPIYNFGLQGTYRWASLPMGAGVPCSVNLPAGSLSSSSDQVSVVPYSTDITVNSLYWLGINIASNWGLDGVSWLNNF